MGCPINLSQGNPEVRSRNNPFP